MAKRFIDTDFFKSPFVRSLKGPLKSLYSYIICDCSGAGIWTKDLEIASVYIGQNVSEDEWKVFIDSGKAIDLKDGKFFFPDFIEHQYPKGLSDKNPAHNNFIIELKKYGLINEALKVLPSPLKGTKVMVMVKEKVKVEEKVKESEVMIYPTFDDFWNEYDKKVGDKSKVEKKFNKLSQKDKDAIMEYLPKYKMAQPDKKYRKNPETFLNNKSWNDEIIESQKRNNKTGPSAEYLKDLARRVAGTT